jgi:hypothetical protein
VARNIEVKAPIPSVGGLLETVAAIADEGPTEIAQDDTFFRGSYGRLKLRAFSDGQGRTDFLSAP